MISANIIDRVSDLPTLPSFFHELTRVTDDPDSSAFDVAEVIERDQVLAAKVLKLVNSAFYGISRKITSIEQSTALLGINAIKNLLLATSIIKAFDGIKNINGLWIHALTVAIGSKVIGSRMFYREVEELFLCGLLHDIGKVVEIKYFPDEVKIIQEKCVAENKLFWKAEQELYGVGHERIGQLLLLQWKVPEKISKVVGFHHHPHGKGDYALETTIVFLADAIGRELKLGESLDGNIHVNVDKEHLDMVNLSTLDDKEITDTIVSETEEISRIFLS